MVIAFDTSVLVAAFVTSHPKHAQALTWLKKAKKNDFKWIVSAHTIAECYAVLTRLPLTPRLTPSIAKLLIEENIKKSAKIISLSSIEYMKLMNEIADKGLTGGIIYDALTIKAAQKAKATKILTFNLKDFQRILPQHVDYFESP